MALFGGLISLQKILHRRRKVKAFHEGKPSLSMKANMCHVLTRKRTEYMGIFYITFFKLHFLAMNVVKLEKLSSNLKVF